MKVRLYYDWKRERWRLDYRINGVRCQPSFDTKAAAEAEQSIVLGEVSRARAELLTLSRDEQSEIVDLLREARAEGFTLREALQSYKLTRHRVKHFTVQQCFDDLMTEKRAMRLSDATIGALDTIVGRFADLHPQKLITKVTREDVLAWLQNKDWGARTFNTYLTALNTFFLWCVHCDRITKSPSASIKKIPQRQMPDIDEPPVILDADQLQRLLLAAWYNDPAMIRPIALGAFGGLRPEREARGLHKDDFGESQILIRGANAKDRARRYIEINGILGAWLALCPKLAPMTNFRRRFELLRAQSGLIRWKKTRKVERKEVQWTGWGHDCLRHTFASNYLPAHGAEKTIEQLGHGDYEMLFGHYRALRSKAQAQEFWQHFWELALNLGRRLPSY